MAGVRGAYRGLLPKQNATGGKTRLGRISKLGNRHLRALLVLGAHATLYRMKSGKRQSRLADWARVLLANKPFRPVAVASGQQDGAHRLRAPPNDINKESFFDADKGSRLKAC